MPEPIDDMFAKLQTQRGLMKAMLKHVGEPGFCKGCGQEIAWVFHRDTSKNTPYDLDGTNHFITCPKAKDFRQKKAGGE